MVISLHVFLISAWQTTASLYQRLIQALIELKIKILSDQPRLVWRRSVDLRY